MSDLHAYTVIGIHEDGHENRFAESYLAVDPADAECQALCDHPNLLIAGVAKGAVSMVDEDPAVVASMQPMREAVGA